MRVGAAFVQTLASQVLQSLASIAAGVLIARSLGPVGQGRYATFVAGVALGAFLVSLGQFHGNVLAAAANRAPPRVLLLRALIHGCLVFAVMLPGIVIWIGLASSHNTVVLSLLFVVVLSLEATAQMIGGINLGQHHVTGWNAATMTQRVSFFAIVALVASLQGLRLEFVMAAWAMATTLSVFISSTWVWARSDPSPLSISAIWSGWGKRLSQSLRAFITVALTLVLVRADVWMLGPMLGIGTVGQVSVATYLAEWLWYAPTILGSLLFATVAADNNGKAIHQVARSSRLVASVLIPLMIVLLLCGPWLVFRIYGAAYHEAGAIFRILLPGATALGIHLVIDAYFAGTGFPPITIWAALVAVVAKCGLNLIVVPSFGALGAVGVTSLVYIGLLVVKVGGLARSPGVHWRDLFFLNRSDLSYVKGKIQALRGQ